MYKMQRVIYIYYLCIYLLPDRMLLRTCLLLFLHEDVKTSGLSLFFAFSFGCTVVTPIFLKYIYFICFTQKEVSECLPYVRF